MPYRSTHFYKLDADPHSAIMKRSVVIKGRKTSVSLEDIFWAALRHIALDQRTTISEIVAKIDAKRNGSTRSLAIRQFIMADMQDRALNHVNHRESDSPDDSIEEAEVEPNETKELVKTPKLAPVD